MPRELRVLAVRAFLVANQLALVFFLSRPLGVDGLGHYFVLVATARVLQIGFEAGLPEQQASATADGSGGTRRDMLAGARISLALALPVIVFALIIELKTTTAWFSVFVVLLAFLRALARQSSEIQRARRQLLDATVLDGLGDLVLLSTIALTTTLITSPALAIGFTALGALLLNVYGIARLPTATDATDWKPAARPRVVGARLGQQALTYADVPLLAAVSGPAAVAVYGTASRLALAASMPLSLSNQVTLPHLIRLLGPDPRNAAQSLTKRVRIAFAASVALVTVVVLVSPLLFDRLGSDDFGASFWVLVVLASGQAVNAATGPCVLGLVYGGLDRLALKISVVSGVVALVAGAGLAFQAGPLGLAIGFSAGTMLQNLWAGTALRRERRVDVSIVGSLS